MQNQIESFRVALDAAPVSRYQIMLLTLLALLLVTDGYDAQVLGYVVPAIARDWSLEKSAFGPVFSANLLGLTLGSLLVTQIADRLGVRRILLACVIIYSSLTLLMAWASSLNQLMALRFFCGIGMGGAMPCAMALMAEYSAPRLRTLMVTIAACGFSLGGAAGGFVAAGVINTFGWQAVFMVGAIAPLTLFPFLLRLLPESLPRLLRDPPPYQRLLAVSQSIVPQWTPPAAIVEDRLQKTTSKIMVVELFAKGYALPTLLLWSTFVVSLILLYFMVSWLPTLLSESGLPLTTANLVTSLFLFAGTLGAIGLAWFADRLQHKVRLLACVLTGSALSSVMMGLSHDTPLYLVPWVFVAGVCIIGGQLTLNAFVSNFYPSHVRATGAGWALGVGRFGSILGPLFGSMFLSMHVAVEHIFFFCAVPAMLGALFILKVKNPADASKNTHTTAPSMKHTKP